MRVFKKPKFILALILTLAVLLRVPLLGDLPFGLTIDEAGQGYSAYSILKTGKDEWGDFLPLNPRGFGDYKPPIFMYLLVPSIAIFGLSEFAVRFPSAIAGILTVWVLYFLVKVLFNNEASRPFAVHSDAVSSHTTIPEGFRSIHPRPKNMLWAVVPYDKTLGLVSSFLLAISPWHVYYSRLGWESNIGLLFFCIGLWLFLKALQKNIFLPLSVLSFGLAALSYHSFKVLVPLTVLGLVIMFFDKVRKIKKDITAAAIGVIVIFSLVLGYGFVFSGAGRRASDQSVLKEENLGQLRQIQYDDKLPQPWGRILNNKYEFFLSKLTDNYIGYYSLPFLFGPHRSDSSILNFPGKGLFYIWQLPLLIMGIFCLIKEKNKAGLVILLWVVVAPIPASLTQDYQHAGRAQALFPALTIISAVGFLYLFKVIRSHKLKLAAFWIFVVITIISLNLRVDDYLFNTFNHPLGGLVQGYREAINYTQGNKNKYQKIIFTKAFSEPQAFLAFYSKMDPKLFQAVSQSWKGFEGKGYRFLDMTDYSLGKYDFRMIDVSRDRHEKNSLIIGSSKEITPDLKTVAVFKNLEGKIIFAAIEADEIPY